MPLGTKFTNIKILELGNVCERQVEKKTPSLQYVSLNTMTSPSSSSSLSFYIYT